MAKALKSASRVRQLAFPVGGLNRRTGFDSQPRGTTPWAINVRPEDPGTLRLRGGSRPGLTATSYTPPVSLLDDSLLTEGGVSITTEAGGSIISGNLPPGVTFACLYRDRLICTGDPATNPPDVAVYCSRQGAHADFQYQADVGDKGRAIVFQLSEAGELGGLPTALIPHKDQYLLAATASTLWAIHGDPADDGTMRNVHREVGIVSPTAWCRVVDDFVFLAQNDVYRVHCSGEGLTNLSKGTLPEELRGLNTATATVSMGYDHDGRGVYLFVYDSGLTTQTHWYFDLNRYSEELPGAFWPIRFPSGMDPVAVWEVAGQLILKGQDSTYRVIGGANDAGTAIASHLLLGPMLLEDAFRYGQILSVQGVLGESSGNVAWNILVGDTAEEVVASAKTAIAAWTPGGFVTMPGVMTVAGTWAGTYIWNGVDAAWEKTPTNFVENYDTGDINSGWQLFYGDIPVDETSPGAPITGPWPNGTQISFPALSNVVYSGQWSAGRNHSDYPRSRGVWAIIWLAAATPWAMEKVLIETISSGRWR